MIKQISSIIKTRQFILETIKDLSDEQLNRVPANFNNNIIWNMGHLIAAQQGVCYRRSGLPLKVDESFFDTYKPGTKPELKLSPQEIEIIKNLLFSTLDQLEEDYQAKIFGNYGSFSTRYGLEIASIENAIDFLPYHEGLHTGTIFSLRRLVMQN
ncbi:MAG: DinB family protein [Flavisolibacter sp.]